MPNTKVFGQKCSGVKKADCKPPCSWTTGKGCKKSAVNSKSPITPDIAKMLKEMDDLRSEVAKESHKKRSLSKDLTELISHTKKKDKDIDSLRSKLNKFAKDMENAENTAKKDVSLMGELSRKTLMLNSRLVQVEERLRACNKERDELASQVQKLKRNA